MVSCSFFFSYCLYDCRIFCFVLLEEENDALSVYNVWDNCNLPSLHSAFLYVKHKLHIPEIFPRAK